MIELIKYNKSAFTLIEITIALLILAVGLVGILALFPVGFDAAGRAGNVTVATFKAQKSIEELKRDGYSSAIARDGEQGWCSVDPVATYDYFEYEITAEDVSGLAGSLAEVTVDIYWPAANPIDGIRTNQRNVQLTTYIARYEP